jgi:alpha-ketoglutarate-dependent taurine dioxygenase
MDSSGVGVALVERNNRQALIDQDREELVMRVLSTGSVLLRHVSPGLEPFEALTRLFCDQFYPTSNRHVRRPLEGDGYSNEVAQSNFILLGHTEGTYRPYPPAPDLCFFMCVTAPSSPGGETTLVDGVKFLKRIRADLRGRFEREGIVYGMSWEREKWQMEFSVRDKASLRDLLAKLPGVSYFLRDDVLHLRFATRAISVTQSGTAAFAPALLAHLPTVDHPNYRGLPVYAKASNRVFFGNGEEIPGETVNELIDIHDDLVLGHRWQVGDVLIVDNTRLMHGRRMTATPCERRIASRFGWLKSDLLRRCTGYGSRTI